MAFVKLPEDLARPSAPPGAADYELVVFAGAATSDAPEKRIRLVSPWGQSEFAASDAPVEIAPDDVVAVIAVIGDRDEDGPIICAANLDRDDRADLVARERQILAALRLASAERTLLRRLGDEGPRAALALAQAVIAGGVAAALAATFLAARSGGDAAVWTEETVARLAEGGPALAAAGAAGAAASLAVGEARAHAARLARRARRRAALASVWAAAGEALLFVQTHAAMFRPQPGGGGVKPDVFEPLPPRRRSDPNAGARPRRAPADPHSVTSRPGSVKLPPYLSD